MGNTAGGKGLPKNSRKSLSQLCKSVHETQNGALMKKVILTTFLALSTFLACTDNTAVDGVRDLQVSISVDSANPDVQIVQILDTTVDVWVNPCDNLRNTDELYCECNPTCCQRQTWYCPPTGTEIQAKYAILDICGDDLSPCDRNRDPNCPPAEILEETGCQHAFDCPPGINEDFTLTYDCEINGIAGTQQ